MAFVWIDRKLTSQAALEASQTALEASQATRKKFQSRSR
jgi:hypothetical protein